MAPGVQRVGTPPRPAAHPMPITGQAEGEEEEAQAAPMALAPVPSAPRGAAAMIPGVASPGAALCLPLPFARI